MFNCNCNSKSIVIPAAVVLILMLSLVVWLNVDTADKVRKSGNVPAQNTISVLGTGEVYAAPDLAITTFSVVVEKETVGEAMAENTEKMNAVIDFVKSEGVESKDLKTTNFYISPRYEWYDSSNCPAYASYCYPGQRVLVGYEVSQSLQVKIRDMAKIGKLIQGATDAGANEIGSLQFTVDKQDELKAQARAQAIEQAKTKAEELAGQLDIDLVRIVSFNESSVLPYYYYLDKAVGMGGGESAAAPQVETGENKIEVTVNIVYEIK